MTDTHEHSSSLLPVVNPPRYQNFTRTLSAMMDEVYDWAVSKGWDPDPTRTFGDVCALLHSEVSEALEAWRQWNLADQTVLGEKPEGVGSEFADILIRLLHYSRVYDIDLHYEVQRVADLDPDPVTSFGDVCASLHFGISELLYTYGHWGLSNISDTPTPEGVGPEFGRLFVRLVRYSSLLGIDLPAEYSRKMAYNHTRAYRHGNRAM